MKTGRIFLGVVLAFGLTLLGNNLYAQTAPNITYTPAINVYTINTTITNPTLSNSGGAVAAFAFGTGVPLTGATLNNPYGMGIDPNGNIYVTNYGNNSISEYNSLGVYQTTFGTAVNISNPAGIVFDNSGNGYVLNYNRTNNGLGNHHGNAYVDQYSSTGVYQSTIIQGLNTATGIAIDLSNNLYVAQGSYNNGNNTVSQFNTLGALAFTTNGVNTVNPVAVAVDGAGNFYALDNTNKNVVKYNSTGTYVSTLITGFTNPNSIWLDGAGNIYVGDSAAVPSVGNTTGSVKVYNSVGTLITSIAGLDDPEGLVTDSKGNLYVSDFTNNTVTKYPPTGGYHLSAPLPASLIFSNNGGTFSGMPTVSFNATNYTVTAYNAGGSSTSNIITLSCPPNLAAPDISYVPSINVFTIGSVITNLVPTNIGGVPTSWTITPATLTTSTGLTFSGGAGGTGTFSGTPTTKSAAKVYTITATNASGSSTTTVSIACVVDNFWTGKMSSDWTDKQNWSTKSVPTVTDLASIGVVAYLPKPSPIITANTPAYYVTFGSNAGNFTVQTGGTFTVNNILEVTSLATQNFVGTGTGAINIVPGAFVNMNSTGVLTITNSGAANLVTLQSDATGSATISQMTTGSITGAVNVQRYITGGAGYRGYRLLSSPVYGTTISSNNVYSVNYVKNSCFVKGTTGIAGGFDVTGNPTIFLYRENLAPVNFSFTGGNYRGINTFGTTPNYNYLIDNDGANAFNILVGNGYLFFFRGDRNAVGQTVATESLTTYVPTATTLTASGTLNQGQITMYDWYTPTSANLGFTTISGSILIEGFNLAGNPYPSSIDWEQYNTTTSTTGIYAPNVSSTVYELNPKTQNYDTYQKGGLFTNSGTRTIVSGQGFFVLASNASAQLIFNETAKVATQNAGLSLMMGKPVNQIVNNQFLRLQLALDSVNTDDMLISFNDKAKTSFNIAEDAPYRQGNGKVSLASLSSDNVLLAINTRPLLHQGQTIPLKVGAYADGVYTLNLTALEKIPQLYDIWLMDAYKKDSLDLRHNRTYSFNIALSNPATYGSGRFSLVIRQNPALALRLLRFNATKTLSGAQIVWTTANEQNYTYFTVERSTNGGTTFNVLNSVVSSGLGTYSFLDKDPVTGTDSYRLELQDLNGVISYSKIINLKYENTSNRSNSNISVYPNPVSSTLNLVITPPNGSELPTYASTEHNLAATQNTTAIIYGIKIITKSGVVIKTATSSSPNWQANVSNLTPGAYVIQVINNSNNSLVGQLTFVKL